MNKGYDTTLPYRDRLLAYMPFIRKRANLYCGIHPANGEPNDFIQDTFLLGLQHESTYDPRYAFGTWVRYLCRRVADNNKKKRRTAAGSAKHVDIDTVFDLSVPATQQGYAELSEALRNLSGTRDSEVLLRIAMGEELHEIGDTMGIGKERVRQLKVRERARLCRLMGEVERAA